MLPDSIWPVSVNDHLVEPADLFAQHLPQAMRAAAPRVVADDAGDHWIIGKQRLSIATMLPTPLLRADPARRTTRYADLAPAASDPAARLAAMDRDQVAVHTLMPHLLGFAGERLAALGDAALWAACVRAYNDFLLGEFCAHAPRRLVGIAVLPFTDPAASIAEIGRVAALGARGISLPHDPLHIGAPAYHDASWQRVFDAANDAGLPVFIHIASSGYAWAPPGAPDWRPPGVMVTLANLDVMLTAADLAFSPLLAARPERKIILLEANLAWLPYWEERADFAVNRRDDLKPGRPTSAVMHDQIMASFIHDPLAIADRARIGLDRFLWQSDYPHTDCVWPDSRAVLAAQLAAVPEGEAIAIAAGNARRLLKLAD